MGKAKKAEQELLVVETENVVRVGKEEKQFVQLGGEEFVNEGIKKFVTVPLPNTNEMEMTVFENEVSKEDDESPFESNGDELIMVSSRKNDDDGNIKITSKKADDLKPEED